MPNIYYINSVGERIDFDNQTYYLNRNTDLLSYEWKYKNSEYADKIASFNMKFTKKQMSIGILAKRDADYHAALKRINDVFDVDVRTVKAGRLYVNNEYVSCYFVASKLARVDTSNKSKNVVLKPYTIICEDGQWLERMLFEYDIEEQEKRANKTYKAMIVDGLDIPEYEDVQTVEKLKLANNVICKSFDKIYGSDEGLGVERDGKIYIDINPLSIIKDEYAHAFKKGTNAKGYEIIKRKGWSRTNAFLNPFPMSIGYSFLVRNEKPNETIIACGFNANGNILDESVGRYDAGNGTYSFSFRSPLIKYIIISFSYIKENDYIDFFDYSKDFRKYADFSLEVSKKLNKSEYLEYDSNLDELTLFYNAGHISLSSDIVDEYKEKIVSQNVRPFNWYIQNGLFNAKVDAFSNIKNQENTSKTIYAMKNGLIVDFRTITSETKQPLIFAADCYEFTSNISDLYTKIIDYKSDDSLDYLYDFNYDLKTDVESIQITNDTVENADFIMKIYGNASNPTVYIGNNVYFVNVEVPATDILIIDSVEKRVYRKNLINGNEINCFKYRDRDNYIFQKIPKGTHSVVRNTNFKVEIEIIEYRSEPAWWI